MLAIEGDGTDVDVLEETGIGDADLLVASTDDGETNLATCAIAKTAGGVFTVARVWDVNYLDTWNRSTRAFDVGLMVSPDVLTARTSWTSSTSRPRSPSTLRGGTRLDG